MGGSSGYIKLHRQIQENQIWTQDPACRARAWIDLLLLASHNEHKTIIKNKPFILNRGDVVISYRFLQRRWKWGVGKTLGFMRLLESDGMIVKKRSGSGSGSPSIYSIVNYDIYQGDDYQSGTLLGTLAERLRNASGTKPRRDKKGKENTSAVRRTFSDLHIGESRKASGPEEEFDEEAAQKSLEKELEETEARLRSKPNLTKKEKQWLELRTRKKKQGT